MPNDARQNELLDKLADHLLEAGIAGSSLRALASAANTSDRMLLYYFPDKASLLSAALHHVAARLGAIKDAAPVPPAPPDAAAARLAKIMLAPEMRPYVRLWLEVVAAAARGDALCREVGEEIGRGFLEWGGAQIDCPDQARPAEAARLLASVQGMVLLSGAGLDDICDAALPLIAGERA